MLSTQEAANLLIAHLGETVRARHSVFVGFLMAHLAELLSEDRILWEVTGLCHDLDFEATADDRSRHGIVTAEWLEGDLPYVALLAIQSHDHRTGIISETPLAVALKLADAVAVGELGVGRVAMLEALGAATPTARVDSSFYCLALRWSWAVRQRQSRRCRVVAAGPVLNCELNKRLHPRGDAPRLRDAAV